MEDVPIAVWGQWLKARSAVYHPERDPDSKRWQTFYAAPLRSWLKAYRVSQTHMRVEFHATCPCRLAD